MAMATPPWAAAAVACGGRGQGGKCGLSQGLWELGVNKTHLHSSLQSPEETLPAIGQVLQAPLLTQLHLTQQPTHLGQGDGGAVVAGSKGGGSGARHGHAAVGEGLGGRLGNGNAACIWRGGQMEASELGAGGMEGVPAGLPLPATGSALPQIIDPASCSCAHPSQPERWRCCQRAPRRSPAPYNRQAQHSGQVRCMACCVHCKRAMCCTAPRQGGSASVACALSTPSPAARATHCALASDTATAPGPWAAALELAIAVPVPVAAALLRDTAVPPWEASATELATAVASSLRAVEAGWRAGQGEQWLGVGAGRPAGTPLQWSLRQLPRPCHAPPLPALLPKRRSGWSQGASPSWPLP